MNAQAGNPEQIHIDVSADLREAALALARAEAAPPLEVQLDASRAEKLVVQARDALIEASRRDPSAPHSPQRKALLARLNGVLSMIVGIEYPSNFVRREMITEAREHLDMMIEDG